jgi:methyltransferase
VTDAYASVSGARFTALPAGLVVLVVLMVAERLAEVVLARRHTRWARAHGGVEFGRGHYPVMIALHVAFLAGIVVEVALTGGHFVPALGWPALAVVVLANVVRTWCVKALGRRWTTRVIVVPGMPLVRHGPYRRLRHPNYLIVVAEGIALPLVYGAWITALLFTAANTALLAVRVRTEDAALAGCALLPCAVPEPVAGGE